MSYEISLNEVSTTRDEDSFPRIKEVLITRKLFCTLPSFGRNVIYMYITYRLNFKVNANHNQCQIMGKSHESDLHTNMYSHPDKICVSRRVFNKVVGDA